MVLYGFCSANFAGLIGLVVWGRVSGFRVWGFGWTYRVSTGFFVGMFALASGLGFGLNPGLGFRVWGLGFGCCGLHGGLF